MSERCASVIINGRTARASRALRWQRGLFCLLCPIPVSASYRKEPSMDSERWHRRRMGLYLNLIGLKRRMTLGTRVLMVDGEKKIYLIRHTYAPGWHFPGGGV